MANSVLPSGENVTPGELAVLGLLRAADVQLVARDRVGAAALGRPEEVLDALAVLGDDQAAVRRDGDVVGAVERAVLRRVRVDAQEHLQGQRAALRVVEPDLAVVLDGGALVTGEGGHDVRAAVGPPHALQLAGAGDRTVGELLAHRDGPGVAVRYVDPVHAVHGAGLRGPREVVDELAGLVEALERLEHARVVGEGAQLAPRPCRKPCGGTSGRAARWGPRRPR